MGSAVWKRGVHQRCCRSAELKRRVPNLCCRAPMGIEAKLAEQRRKGGGQEGGMKSRSVNLGRGAPNPGRGASMGNEECSPSGGTPKRGMVGKECGIEYRSNNPD